MKKRTHGGAREGAGRPPAEDKVDHVVSFRLDSEQHAAAVALAEKTSRSVHSLAKLMVLTAIGAAAEVPAKLAGLAVRDADEPKQAAPTHREAARTADEREHCKSCDAPIIWAIREGGSKRMAVNAAPVADGNVLLFHSWQLRRGFGRVPILGARVLTLAAQRRARRERRPLYTSHFETCQRAQIETPTPPDRREK